MVAYKYFNFRAAFFMAEAVVVLTYLGIMIIYLAEKLSVSFSFNFVVPGVLVVFGLSLLFTKLRLEGKVLKKKSLSIPENMVKLVDNDRAAILKQFKSYPKVEESRMLLEREIARRLGEFSVSEIMVSIEALYADYGVDRREMYDRINHWISVDPLCAEIKVKDGAKRYKIM